MKTRQKKMLEKRLLQALQSRFGDPDAEAPMTLRDQPNEIVFTALRPKDSPPERSGPMGLGQMPSLPQPSEMWEDPMTSGEATVQQMLASSQGGRDVAPTVDVQARPQTAQQPAPVPQPQPQAQAAPQPSEQEMMQQLLVSG